MRLRAPPGPDYPVRVCALPVPPGAKAVVIDGAPAPLPKPRADRILLIGDTGCRITRVVNQGCNDGADWPFPAGAAALAAQQADLVIHVGDFHYREASCRPLNASCAGSPAGDAWDVWEADFFRPGRQLLEAAPFVFVRGNHEECQRGGKGWARLLDPYVFDGATGCVGAGAPFLADIGSPGLVVMDVATASEFRVNEAQAETYRKQFASVATLAPSGPVWLAFHRPIRASGGGAFGFTLGDNKTLAAAARGAIPANVQALLSGHIHTFQALAFEDDLPVQIVSGHAGAELHTTAPSSPLGLTIDGARVKSGAGASGVFGYVLLERAGEDWRLTNFEFSGRRRESCLMRGRALDCE